MPRTGTASTHATGHSLTERAKLAVESVNGSGSTHGEEAERLVVKRLREVLPPTVAVLPNVRWLLRDQKRGYLRKGEADVVIGEADRGILVLEVKSGQIRRDADGAWWAGPRRLDRSPFVQAEDSRYSLVRKLQELPGWAAGLAPIAGEGVAFPDVELDSMKGKLGLLGPDVDAGLIADQSMFVDTDEGRRELGGFIDRAFAAWSGKPGTSAARARRHRPACRDARGAVRDQADAPERDRGR